MLAAARDRAAAEKVPPPAPPPPALVAACEAASRQTGAVTKAGAKAFFEQHFTPNAVVHTGPNGLLTGYYEPLLTGSRTPQGEYPDADLQAPAGSGEPRRRDAARRRRRGAHACAQDRRGRRALRHARGQIEQGALKGKSLELMYLTDPVEVFFMQIQGSGRVKLTDGSVVRVHYDGKNGHPYSSIGRYLIDKGLLAADKVSMGALKKWLKADPERGKKVMWQNASYVFFRELKGAEQPRARWAPCRSPLTPGRSLAVDPGHHALGLPIYVSAAGMKHVNKAGVFNRLMVAQDVGSAIKGPERGDIYFGSGDAAGRLAGVTKHAGKFIVLLPNDDAGASRARRARQPRRKPGDEPGRPEVRRRRPRRHRGRGPALGARDAQPRRRSRPSRASCRPLRRPSRAAEPPRPASRASRKAPAPRASRAPPRRQSQRARPPLADFDRRKARQIASGKIEVEARIDLHGLRQRDARARLRAFLFAAHAKGHKTVLVITGKGGEEPADASAALMGERQRGVIRRSVPHWLEEPDLRAVVLSYTQAGPRHGGAGALYVQLRKRGAWPLGRSRVRAGPCGARLRATRMARAAAARLRSGRAGKPSQAAHPVVHDDGAGHGQVDAEARGDAHHVVAARQQLGRQRALLGPQHIGRAQRMAEARQVDRLVQQLHPDQPAALGQRQLVDALPVVVRQVLLALGGVGARLQRLVGGADGKGEAAPNPCAERIRLPRFRPWRCAPRRCRSSRAVEAAGTGWRIGS